MSFSLNSNINFILEVSPIFLWQLSELSLREKCPYSEIFWSVFSRVKAEYRDVRSISPYPIRMRENVDQKKSEYDTINAVKNF